MAHFYAQVYALVRRVPAGRVTTYGAIARALGAPGWARQVGWALAALPAASDEDVPAHRVVNAHGGLAGRAFGSPAVQRALLEEEGVEFGAGDRVRLARALWEPDDLDAGPPGPTEQNRLPD